MEVSGRLHAVATLTLGRNPQLSLQMGWVGSNANLDAREKGTTFGSASNQSPVCNPVNTVTI